MMDRVREGLAIVGGSALILLACGIKGPPRAPVPPPAAAPPPPPSAEAQQGPLEPTTEPSSTVVRPGEGPQEAPPSGTTRELPPDGGT